MTHNQAIAVLVVRVDEGAVDIDVTPRARSIRGRFVLAHDQNLSLFDEGDRQSIPRESTVNHPAGPPPVCGISEQGIADIVIDPDARVRAGFWGSSRSGQHRGVGMLCPTWKGLPVIYDPLHRPSPRGLAAVLSLAWSTSRAPAVTPSMLSEVKSTRRCLLLQRPLRRS